MNEEMDVLLPSFEILGSGISAWGLGTCRIEFPPFATYKAAFVFSLQSLEKLISGADQWLMNSWRDRFLRPELEREEQIFLGLREQLFLVCGVAAFRAFGRVSSTSILPRICNFPLFHSRNMPLCVFWVGKGWERITKEKYKEVPATEPGPTVKGWSVREKTENAIKERDGSDRHCWSAVCEGSFYIPGNNAWLPASLNQFLYQALAYNFRCQYVLARRADQYSFCALLKKQIPSNQLGENNDLMLWKWIPIGNCRTHSSKMRTVSRTVIF